MATSIRPISHQSTNEKVLEIIRPLIGPESRIADIGAGEGYFSMRVGEFLRGERATEPRSVISACDVFPENFRYPGVDCDKIEADGRLPYKDGVFDVACSLEVVEHVEDQFHFCREIFRILKPGGVAIISTPNVLNMNSRYRNLHSGFATLFDPLLLSSTDPVHTSGHIHPVTYYYLAYQLHRAGFTSVSVHFDRFKRSALGLLAVFGLPMFVGNALFARRLRKRRPQVARENQPILADLRSFKMLTSRSVIAMAVR